MAEQPPSTVEIQRVGDSVLLTIDGTTNILFSRGDAAEIGLGLYKVASLGADTLEEAITGERR